MKIYTKKGDKGQTGLIGGSRVSKNDLRINAYGTVDELNAHVGLLRDLVADDEIKQKIYQYLKGMKKKQKKSKRKGKKSKRKGKKSKRKKSSKKKNII